MVAERDEMDVRAACGHTGPVRSFHSWTASGCKKDVHDSIICNKIELHPAEHKQTTKKDGANNKENNKEIVRTTKRWCEQQRDGSSRFWLDEAETLPCSERWFECWKRELQQVPSGRPTPEELQQCSECFMNAQMMQRTWQRKE
eukprot:978428-Prymnesium_polylepis.1